MRTGNMVSSAIILIHGAASVFAQTGSGSHLLPRAAKTMESKATNSDDWVHIDETGQVPAEPDYCCGNPPSESEKGSVAITFDRWPEASMTEGMRMIVLTTRAQAKQLEIPLTESAVAGAQAFHSVKSEGCVATTKTTRKVLTFDAFWISGKVALYIGVTGVSPETAMKYVEEVVAKAKALDYAKVKD